MNRTLRVRQSRGAAFLILVGVLALLNQWHILSWGQSWPFFLILAGILALVERLAWAADLREWQVNQPSAIPQSASAVYPNTTEQEGGPK